MLPRKPQTKHDTARRASALLLAAALWLGAAAPPAAVAQSGNLLSNGSFEFGYYHQDGIPELAVPLNWRVYYVDGGTFPGILPDQTAYRPETVVWHRGQAPANEQGLFWRDGNYTLKVFKPWAPLYAALSQNVGGLQTGATYTLTAYVYVDVVAAYDGAEKVPPANDPEHGDDVRLRLGAGRLGAVWRDASSIDYSGWVMAANRYPFHQSMVPLVFTFQAPGPQISVWIEMMSVSGYLNNGFFVDAVSLTGPSGASAGPVGPALPAAPFAPPAAAPVPPTPTPTPARITPADITLANSTTYTVQAGESIAKIAKKVGVPTIAIINANGLREPWVVRPGQTLVIPDPSKFYTVQRGDTLSQIAARYGTTIAFLQSVNNLRSASVYAGQILVVP